MWLSLFQKLFGNTVYRMHSAGLFNKIKEDVTRGRPEVPPPRYRVNQPLNLTQLAGATTILAIGLQLAIMAFLGELFRKH